MENVMDLLDRYVNAIGKHLPQKTRADIETEIRSTLEDMLADRSEKTGQPVDDAMVKDLLKEYGAPDKVAGTYLPERYLIGPRMFPFFWMVVKIVFAVLTTLAIIGLGIRVGTAPVPAEIALSTAGKALLEYIQGMIAAVGNIVVVFAILERVLPESQVSQLNPSDEKDWDPAMLMMEPDSDDVKPWEPIVTIFFMLVGLAVFNFYPHIIGVMVNPESVQFIPILSDAFFTYLPWLNLLWLLGVGVQMVLLRQGRYTPPIRWISIALEIGGVALAAAMLAGPSLVGITTGQLTGAGMDAEAADILVKVFSIGVRIGLVVAVVASTVEIVKDLYHMVIKPIRPRTIIIQ
jgi:hypothetical protein